MSGLGLWFTILGGMLATYLTRLSFVVLWRPASLPPRLLRGLRYVLPSILAAIILPSLIMPAGAFDLSWGNHRLLAGSLAAFVAWRSRNPWLTIATGMATLWLLARL